MHHVVADASRDVDSELLSSRRSAAAARPARPARRSSVDAGADAGRPRRRPGGEELGGTDLVAEELDRYIAIEDFLAAHARHQICTSAQPAPLRALHQARQHPVPQHVERLAVTEKLATLDGTSSPRRPSSSIGVHRTNSMQSGSSSRSAARSPLHAPVEGGRLWSRNAGSSSSPPHEHDIKPADAPRTAGADASSRVRTGRAGSTLRSFRPTRIRPRGRSLLSLLFIGVAGHRRTSRTGSGRGHPARLLDRLEAERAVRARPRQHDAFERGQVPASERKKEPMEARVFTQGGQGRRSSCAGSCRIASNRVADHETWLWLDLGPVGGDFDLDVADLRQQARQRKLSRRRGAERLRRAAFSSRS